MAPISFFLMRRAINEDYTGKYRERREYRPLIRNAIVPKFVAKATEFRGGTAKLVGVRARIWRPILVQSRLLPPLSRRRYRVHRTLETIIDSVLRGVDLPISASILGKHAQSPPRRWIRLSAGIEMTTGAVEPVPDICFRVALGPGQHFFSYRIAAPTVPLESFSRPARTTEQGWCVLVVGCQRTRRGRRRPRFRQRAGIAALVELRLAGSRAS